MKLNPKVQYMDTSTQVIKTGAEWMEFFKKEARQYLIDLEADIRRGGGDPMKELPSFEEQLDWTITQYSGGEWDHKLVEVNSIGRIK